MNHLRAIALRHLRPLLGVALGVLAFVSGTPAAQAVPAGTSCYQWSETPSANQDAVTNDLRGVTVVSPTSAWSVGYYENTASGFDQTLTERWNGSAWSIVASPQAPNSEIDFLTAVSSTSSTDIWAVGGYVPTGGGWDYTLVEHWTGTSWSVVPSPNISNGDNNLYSVDALSPTNVWAAGYFHSAKTGRDGTLIEHWDGHSWRVITAPNPGNVNNLLFSIAAASPTDIWAVGYVQNSLHGVAQESTLIEHWNGSAWSIVTSPDSTGTGGVLNSVAVTASNDVWAVGYTGLNGNTVTLIEHWNGSSWSIVPSPNLATTNNYLNAVAVVAAHDVWAVGYVLTAHNLDFGPTLIEAWNGTSWHVIPSTSPSSGYSILNAVAAMSKNAIWTVGAQRSDETRFGVTSSYIQQHTSWCA